MLDVAQGVRGGTQTSGGRVSVVARVSGAGIRGKHEVGGSHGSNSSCAFGGISGSDGFVKSTSWKMSHSSVKYTICYTIDQYLGM